MNYSNYRQRILTWLATIVEVQLFITLISLPTLIAWGLPISLLALVGNSLFTPFLASILLLSSLIFFCELCYISSTYFAYVLNHIINVWSTLMSWGSPANLIAYKKPPTFVLILSFVLIVLIIHYSIRKSRIQRISIYVLFLMLFSFINKGLFSTDTTIEYIPHNNRTIVLINTKSHTCLIDPVAIAQRGNASSFVEYTLTQTILQKTGRMGLDYVIIAKPSAQLFKALKKLLLKIPVSYLYIPHLKGDFSYQFWKELEALKLYAQERKCTIIFFEDSQGCTLGNNNILSIIPESHYTKVDRGYYKPAKITGQIDNTGFSFYSP